MPIPEAEELNLLHAHMCQALGDPKRLQILYALHRRPRNVTELANDLGVPQPTISRHLAVLRQRSLVTPVREGPSVNYSLTDSRIIDIIDLMRRIMRDTLERQAGMLT
jgi:ArsR family transcriptional regulator